MVNLSFFIPLLLFIGISQSMDKATFLDTILDSHFIEYNDNKRYLRVGNIKETAHSSWSFASHEGSSNETKLLIDKLIDYLSSPEVPTNINNISTIKDNEDDNTIDLSCCSFINQLFNYPENFYTLEKNSSYIGADKSSDWNVKTHIASIFMIMLFPKQLGHNYENKLDRSGDQNRIYYNKEKFERIKNVILNRTDLTKIDLRFWINLFPNLQTLSIAECKLANLSFSDKLFLAGFNAYGYDNRGTLNVIIDKTQQSIFKITYKDLICMFLQDAFGNDSTECDMYYTDNRYFSSAQQNLEEKMLDVDKIIYQAYVVATGFILKNERFYTSSFWIIFICANLYLCHPYAPSFDPTFGGDFGLGPKNKIWIRTAIRTITYYFACFILLRYFAMTREKFIGQCILFSSLSTALTSSLFFTKKGFNPKALTHLLTGKYSLYNKYTINNIALDNSVDAT